MYTHIPICRHHKQLFTRRERGRERFSSKIELFQSALQFTIYNVKLVPKVMFIYIIFLLSQGGIPVILSKFSIVYETKLDLDILMTNLHIKFHFNICNLCRDNDWKLKKQTDRQQQSNTVYTGKYSPQLYFCPFCPVVSGRI